MLDLDNTEKNPKMITVAPQIRKLASKIIAADNKALEEGVEVEINQNALREGRLAVSVNGEEVYNEEASAEELAQFKLVEAAPAKKAIREHTDYSGLGLLYESEDDDEWEEMSEDDAEIAAQFAELDNEDPEGIPPKWRFASRLIMISNLKKTDLNDAVLSRTLSYELRLTQEEFMARLAQILPHMLTDVETEDGKLSSTIAWNKTHQVDADNKVLRGNDNRKNDVTYELTFVKSVAPKDVVICPNCGAESKAVAGDNCEYCHSKIVIPPKKYVLSKKMVINQK